jgi:tRNA threonylcarbamoyladenosine biosynthesis protein TsaE
MPVDLNLPDAAATEALGAALAAGIGPGRVLHLRGDLGSGKTTLVRGLLRALGYAGRVRSPTYTLVEPYTLSRLHFYHFDLYRLKNHEEWRDSGFQEYFNPDSACAVEWPERAGTLLAPPDLEVTLEFAGTGRRARLSGEPWLSSLRLPS